MVYSLTDSADGQFSIDATSGVIRLEKPLQARSNSALELTVRASDLGIPIPLSALGTVTVSVVGLEDYLPIFLNAEHNTQVPEDAPIDTEVLQLATLTRPGSEKTGYRITGGNEQGKFRLDVHTGEMGRSQLSPLFVGYISFSCTGSIRPDILPSPRSWHPLIIYTLSTFLHRPIIWALFPCGPSLPERIIIPPYLHLELCPGSSVIHSIPAGGFLVSAQPKRLGMPPSFLESNTC